MMKQKTAGYARNVLHEIEKGMKILLCDPQKNRKFIEANIQKVQREIDIITLQIRFEQNKKERLHLQAMGVELMAFRNRLLGVLKKGD